MNGTNLRKLSISILANDGIYPHKASQEHADKTPYSLQSIVLLKQNTHPIKVK